MPNSRLFWSRWALLCGIGCAVVLIAELAFTPPIVFANPAFAKRRPISCESLADLNLPEASSISSELITDGEYTPPGSETMNELPDFCRVSIVVEPAINIEVWLPTETWNRRFKGVGGGGYAGSISWSALGGALRDGYATASTDTGHMSNSSIPFLDGEFAFNSDGSLNWPLIEDFASRSLMEMTVKAKAVIRAFYGKKPKYSYWMGCSTGGRQGLMLVQRMPHAYDGVLSGAPAINWERFIAAEIWPQVVMQQETGGPIDQCALDLANAAAVDACDDLDGIQDGLIEDPRRCDFDPLVLKCADEANPDCNCLTSDEADAIRMIWEGAHGSVGTPLWYGLEPGTPFEGLAGTIPFSIAVTHSRWVKGTDFDWMDLNYENFEQYFNESHLFFNDIIGTDDPNISAFRKSGGKLIIWHGWTDQLIYPQGTIDYYERVVDRMGGWKRTKRFARLFMAPGVNHCQGGVGPNAFGQNADNGAATTPLRENPRYDIFEALVRWVEKGKSPSKVIATKYMNDDPTQGVQRTHPLCAYPKTAVYIGHGNIDDAENFVCRQPHRKRPNFVWHQPR